MVAVERWRWGVVWLLFAATLINYMDRQALAMTQRYLLPEFEPDPALQTALYARVQFAFGLSFALFQLVAGFLIDRYSLRKLYLGAIVVWSAAGVATGFVPAGAVALLMACRVVLGFGEAFNWPCAVAGVRKLIPRESRGLANGIFHSGASLGALAMPFLVLLIVDTATGDGWRTVFVAVGVLGFVWVGAWLGLTRGARAAALDGPPMRDGDAPDGPGPTLAAVFGLRTFWVALVTLVCVNITWHFYNQWFPRFLTEDVRVSGRAEQWVIAGFYVSADLGSLAFGRLSRTLARAGYTVERSRQLVMAIIALITVAATAPACYAFDGDDPRRWACFYVVAAAVMGGFSVAFALVQDVAGRHTAQVLGICGCVSWLAVSGVTAFVGKYAAPGLYEDLFLAIGCVPLVAAAVGFLWPRARASAGDLPRSSLYKSLPIFIRYSASPFAS